MPALIVVGNVLAALASAGFAMVALTAPARLTGGEVTASVRYYSQMFAARSLPIAAAVVVAMAVNPNTAAVIVILAVAGVSQVGDVVIGIATKTAGMVAGAGICALIHLVSVVHLAVT
ncbi:hypothetical protein ACPXB3_07340 [Gordonia sp. DT219]|uniref:hypothetical protein n=1 Tax=Gordonia sp. DT219 TaxID=3416658 RepID=UPI003CF3B419